MIVGIRACIGDVGVQIAIVVKVRKIDFLTLCKEVEELATGGELPGAIVEPDTVVAEGGLPCIEVGVIIEIAQNDRQSVLQAEFLIGHRVRTKSVVDQDAIGSVEEIPDKCIEVTIAIQVAQCNSTAEGVVLKEHLTTVGEPGHGGV